MQGPRRAGVVDLGTQSAVLAAGELAETGAVEVLLEAARLPALGRSLAATGQLSPRTSRALRLHWRSSPRSVRARGVPCARWSARPCFGARRTEPSSHEPLAEAAGATVRIVTGEEEARLAHAGASAGRPGCARRGRRRREHGARDGRRPLGLLRRCGRELARGAWSHGRLEPRGTPRGGEPTDRAGPCGRRDAARLRRCAPRGRHRGERGQPGAGPGRRLLDRGGGRGGHEPEALRAWASRLDLLSLDERRPFAVEAERVRTLPEGLLCLAAALEAVEATSARISVRGLRHAALARVLAAGA